MPKNDLKDMLNNMDKQRMEQFGFKAQCQQFLWDNCPDINDDEEFKETLIVLENLAKIYQEENKKS